MTIPHLDGAPSTSHPAEMSQELEITFEKLHAKLVELHIVWQQYRQLYGNDDDTVSLLNRTAGLFFKIVQDELWDSVLLGISRMTDPPATGKAKNLTIQSLPGLVTDEVLRKDVQQLCTAAVDTAVYARDHRNKRIALQDHGYLVHRSSSALVGVSRQQVELMLAALGGPMIRLHLHFRDTTFLYETFIDVSGARLLVAKLRELERRRT